MENIERYYRLLGINADATLDEIKKAYLEAEQKLLQDFQSEEPEKQAQAQEKLDEIFDAHQKVMKYFMEYGPPKFQENVKKSKLISEVPVTAITSEPSCEPSGATLEVEGQGEEKRSPTISLSKENSSTYKAVNLIIIISITTLVAVSVGVIIAIVALKKSSQESAPSQPLRQAVVTAAPAYKTITSVEKNVERQALATKVDEKKATITKRHGKKMVKIRKHAASDQVTQISRENLENIMKAANLGDAEAQYRLGALYDKGVGVKKDRSEANKWYRKAANQGHEQAQKALEIVHE